MSPRLTILTVGALLGVLLGCRGSTELHGDHSLWSDAPNAVSVYFLRPEHGFQGVTGMAITIDLDGEELLELARGDYTLARLRPGRYEMTVHNWGTEGSNNAMTKVSMPHAFDLRGPGPVYLVFRPPEVDVAAAFQQATFTDVRGNTTLSLTIGPDPPPDAFLVQAVDRETALALTTTLASVGPAQAMPIAST